MKWPEDGPNRDNDHVARSTAELLNGGFDEHVGRLVVRLCARERFRDGPRDRFVHRHDIAEVLTVLAVADGSSILPIQRLVADAWGVPDAVLFEHAIDNLARTSQSRWSRLSIPPTHDFGFDLLHGDQHAASHILRKDPGLPRVGREGNLVGIPACEVLFSYPLDAPLDPMTIESLLTISHGKSRGEPSAITPHLFWRTPEGQLHLQRGQRQATGQRLLPSPEFVECMVRLQKARREPAG